MRAKYKRKNIVEGYLCKSRVFEVTDQKYVRDLLLLFVWDTM